MGTADLNGHLNGVAVDLNGFNDVWSESVEGRGKSRDQVLR